MIYQKSYAPLKKPVKEVLAGVKLDEQGLDDLLLSCDSKWIPNIQRLCTEIQKPLKTVTANEAVATSAMQT